MVTPQDARVRQGLEELNAVDALVRRSVAGVVHDGCWREFIVSVKVKTRTKLIP